MIQIFAPASEHGTAGVEELQQQTVSLLSFKSLPQGDLRHASRASPCWRKYGDGSAGHARRDRTAHRAAPGDAAGLRGRRRRRADALAARWSRRRCFTATASRRGWSSKAIPASKPSRAASRSMPSKCCRKSSSRRTTSAKPARAASPWAPSPRPQRSRSRLVLARGRQRAPRRGKRRDGREATGMTGWLSIWHACCVASSLPRRVTGCCGYHVGGNAQWMPKTVKTIAIPAFANGTLRYKLARLLAGRHHARISHAHQLHHRGRSRPGRRGPHRHACQLERLSRSSSTQPPGAPRASRWSSRFRSPSPSAPPARCCSRSPRLEFRERYEIAADPQTYFDESGTAIERVARDAARTVVSAILENF